MTSASEFIRKSYNVKEVVVRVDSLPNKLGEIEHHVLLRHREGAACRCPECSKVCPVYDGKTPKENQKLSTWRGMDLNGEKVFFHMARPRVECPEHGIHACEVSFAFPGSHFTKDFEYNIVFMAKNETKKAIAEAMRIDWATVGNIISRIHSVMEPDPLKRWETVYMLGLDESSYKKGHKYFTNIVDIGGSQVIGCVIGYTEAALNAYFEQIPEKYRLQVKMVAGDGADWITRVQKKWFPNAVRCVDPFHVDEWATDALDQVRNRAYKEALKEILNELGVKEMPKESELTPEMKEKLWQAKQIKKSLYAVGKAPENLTENQRVLLEMIKNHNSELYRAYLRKEDLRLILKLNDVDQARRRLRSWIRGAACCRTPEFKELSKKIKRNLQLILNTIAMKGNSGKVEAFNGVIKVIQRKAFGFRNMQNMIDMIILYCSNLIFRIPNRYYRDLKKVFAA